MHSFHWANGSWGPAIAGILFGLAATSPVGARVESVGAAGRQAVSLNPNTSVVIDGIYYRSSGDESFAHLLEEMKGFSQGHGHGHDHHHDHGFKEGFNLRHLELMLAADIDPYFKGWAVIAVEDHGAKLEEAVFQTTGLPLGLQLKGGKFFSDFSRQNAMHAHDWNFVDQPLIYRLLLGDHGLHEKGAQISWLAPTPFFLTLGIEALQGDNETLFAYAAEEDNPLNESHGPRLFVSWAKFAPPMSGPHAIQFGLFAARGVHQEEHYDTGEKWFDGHQWLAGADFVYRHTPATAYGYRWLTVEGGYLNRNKNLRLVALDDPVEAFLIGSRLQARQDGFYLQGAYGIAPRWRVGLRGEMAGLTNREREPEEDWEDFDSSYRFSAMLDWTLTEFSRIRLQVNQGGYETDEGREKLTEGLLQVVFSLGAHGAHKF